MEDLPPAGQLTSNNSSFISSPTKHNPLASQSNWSFGWQNDSKNQTNRPPTGVVSYHNQSNIVFGYTKNQFKKQEINPTDYKKKTNPVTEKPVWNYNPKNAGKTTMVLGDEKPDYRKKDEFYKIRTPTTLTGSRRK